jgi:amino acid transporter
MKSPHRASLTQSALTTVLVVVFILVGADPLTVIYPWIVGIASVAILTLYVSASIAVSFSLRRSTTENRVWVTTIAPILAAIAMAAILVLAIVNYGFLTGSTNPIVNSLWVLVPVAAIIGFSLPPNRRHEAIAESTDALADVRGAE